MISIKQKAKDAGWLFAARLISLLSPFCITPVVTRVLEKNEIGLWALIQVVVGFLAMFQDGGLSAYVIKRKDYSEDVQSMVRFCGIVLGVVVGILLIFISIPIAHLMGFGENWTLLLPLSLVYAFGGLSGVLSAELRKESRFKSLFTVTSVPALLSIPLSIFCLLNNFGLWTFPIAAVFIAFGQLLGLCFLLRPSHFKFHRNQLNEICGYTRGLFGFSLFNYWARKMDDVLIGSFIGKAALAIYSNAYRLMMLPIAQITSLLNPLILTYLSKVQDDKVACRRELFGFLRLAGFLAFPPMTFLWLEREWLVFLYLGEGWNNVAEILFWFAPLGMLQTLINPLGNCYMVTGKNDRFFLIGLVNTIVVLAGFVIGLRYGIQGVVLGYFIANLVMLIPNVHMALRTLDGDIFEWFQKTGALWMFPVLAFALNLITQDLTNVQRITYHTFFLGILSIGFGWFWYRDFCTQNIKYLSAKIIKKI